MTNQFEQSCIDKLIMLEEKTGAYVNSLPMPPISENCLDILSVQKIAKDIAKYIGLSGITFIVAIARQDEKVGAHIDLSTQGNEVFIEIDSEMLQLPNVVAATLCHEITHKWLQQNGLQAPTKEDHELLTDIAAVFLGFGKILLNGTKIAKTYEDGHAKSNQTITETKTFGYLTHSQLAFTYRLVCSMRKNPDGIIKTGLNSEAADAMLSTLFSHSLYFSQRFHKKETAEQSITQLKNAIFEIQSQLSEIHKTLIFIQNASLSPVKNFMKDSHRELADYIDREDVSSLAADFDPALRYLKTLRLHFDNVRMLRRIHAMCEKASLYFEKAQSLGRFVSKKQNEQISPNDSEAYRIILCPNDGARLRLPEIEGDILVKCPSCKYKFRHNTQAPNFRKVCKLKSCVRRCLFRSRTLTARSNHIHLCMSEPEGNTWDDTVCWFCKKAQSCKNAKMEIDLHKVLSKNERVVFGGEEIEYQYEKKKTWVPRCEHCKSKHELNNTIFFYLWLAFTLGGLIVLLLYSNDYRSLFGVVSGVILIGIVMGISLFCINMFVSLFWMSEEKYRQHPRLQQLFRQGFVLGKKP